jgi:signal transduction histidine kinase
MALRPARRLPVPPAWLRLPRHTVRFRLTVLYSGLFLAAGAGLLAITYLLVDHSTATVLFANRKGGRVIAIHGPPRGPATRLEHGSPTSQQAQIARQLTAQAAQHARDLHQLVTQSAIALSVMVVLAVVLGWVVAGRVLRPLRAMKAATQRITERSLHERLALPGPEDEVKDLADTIDGLLARLERAFEAQRHFVASASHELRTPLAFNRAIIEVAMSDPDATAEDLRSTCEELLTSGEQQERLLEALLTLATSERGLDHRDRFNLATVAARVVSARRGEAEDRGLEVRVSLGDAVIAGDDDLAERMAANLVDNAIRHNVRGGHLDVRTETRDARPVLTVANTGPLVPEDQVSRLFEPFQRLTGNRTAHPDGHGLGLSIVRAIAVAHDARLKVLLRPAGGLTIEVHFPAPHQQANGHLGVGLRTGTERKIRRQASPG